jgi:PAS domain-containing protein
MVSGEMPTIWQPSSPTAASTSKWRNRNHQLLAEMQTLLSNALVGIVHLRQRRVVSCNRRLEEIFGYTPGELIGESSERFYPSHEIFEKVGARAYAVAARRQETSIPN